MKKALSTFAAGLALCATSAQASEPPSCLNSQEVNGLVAYFLPKVLGEVTKSCSATLPADSYVRTRMPRMVAQLEDARERAWPMAKSAFYKFSGSNGAKEMAGLSDNALRPLVDNVMETKLSIPITPSTCGDVNDILDALAPLSPEQTVHLAATILDITARKDRKMPTCPSGTH